MPMIRTNKKHYREPGHGLKQRIEKLRRDNRGAINPADVEYELNRTISWIKTARNHATKTRPYVDVDLEDVLKVLDSEEGK